MQFFIDPIVHLSATHIVVKDIQPRQIHPTKMQTRQMQPKQKPFNDLTMQLNVAHTGLYIRPRQAATLAD